MAVVYADLRFSRTAHPPQKDITSESLCDDWEVTYENVAPHRDIHGGQAEDPPQAKGPKGFCAGRPRYVLVALCIISLTSLTIIIALSIQLSLVTQQYDETSMKLEILRKEHDHQKSSLNSDILRKDLVAQELQESLGKTTLDLEKNMNDLRKCQEVMKNINLNLQKTLLQKAEGDTAVNDLRGSLQNTESRLQDKTSELIRCESDLKSQKSQYSRTISDLKNKVSTAESKQKTTEDNLSQKQRELSNEKNTVSNLQEEQRRSQSQLQKLSDLEGRLREAQECLSKSCDIRENQGNQENSGDIRENQGNQENSGDNRENQEENSGMDHYCPVGWKQIEETCYYFSSETNTRIKAEEDCTKKNATLAKIQESDSALKAMIQKDKKSFWIGLKKPTYESLWKWPDESVQEDFRYKSGSCAKASPTLESQSCSYPLPWICQKKAMKCRLEAEDLRCFLEKIGVFEEKINE